MMIIFALQIKIRNFCSLPLLKLKLLSFSNGPNDIRVSLIYYMNKGIMQFWNLE